MSKIKFFFVLMAIMVCSSASAQFSNANVRGGQRSSRTFNGLDGKGPESGYKGFVEAGYTVGVGDYGKGRISFMTTHGYQINTFVFAGVGAGVNYLTKSEAWGVPIFADVRANILDHSISPFIDVKIGYSVTDVEGLFFSPSIGCRIAISDKSAFNVSIGYELQKAEFLWYYSGYYGTSKENCGGLALKVGLDF